MKTKILAIPIKEIDSDDYQEFNFDLNTIPRIGEFVLFDNYRNFEVISIDYYLETDEITIYVKEV
jgi:hypothetical protein